MPQKHSLVRAIYLYLFTIIGLVLVVTGSVKFIDMGLKAFVFTKAEEPEKIQNRYYYPAPYPIEKIESLQDNEALTEDEVANLKQFIKNYKEWQDREGKIDYLASSRQREASNNLAMIFVGLPLYLYHWGIIRRETKKSEI
ncbi:MAG: hypothetical protein PHW72_01300 [Candidatus Pacebacteria bacterium]|nr:hypothetical protein [Candidatus Paceibacterota bacterium]